MEQHPEQAIGVLYRENHYSLSILNGLVELAAQRTAARWASRCKPRDVHGSVVSSDVRQDVWADMQRHHKDPRCTLRAPRLPKKRLSLVLHDRALRKIRLRMHPRLPYSPVLVPVSSARETLFGPEPAHGAWQAYVLFDIDLAAQVLNGIWLAAVSSIDAQRLTTVHYRLALPTPPAVLLPGEHRKPGDDGEDGFDDFFGDDAAPGDEPA